MAEESFAASLNGTAAIAVARHQGGVRVVRVRTEVEYDRPVMECQDSSLVTPRRGRARVRCAVHALWLARLESGSISSTTPK